MSRNFPDWISAYMQWTNDSEPSSLYRRWVAISTIAAVLQRKCYLNWGFDRYYPNMYVLLVGPSGARKGTAMAPAVRMLTDMAIKMSAQSTTRQALIRQLKTATSSTHDLATGRIDLHNSLSIVSEEFTVFLGYQCYELMADLCDWFDCKEKWTYDTKNMGRDDISGVWVNLIGATTPHLIRSTLPTDGIGGGLTSRIVFVFSPHKEKLVVFPYIDEAMGKALKEDLEKIHLMHGEFKITKEYFEAYSNWYTTTTPPFEDEKFSGYIERRPTHLRKMSIILSASRSEDKLITVEDFELALAILENAEKVMQNVYIGYGKSSTNDLLQRAIVLVAKAGILPKSALMESMMEDADSFTLDRVLQTMLTMKYIQIELKEGLPLIRWTGPNSVTERLA